jgi:hypothetical protein
MVFQMCEGDISNKPFIEKNFSPEDAVCWMMFKAFEAEVTREQLKRDE